MDWRERGEEVEEVEENLCGVEEKGELLHKILKNGLVWMLQIKAEFFEWIKKVFLTCPVIRWDSSTAYDANWLKTIMGPGHRIMGRKPITLPPMSPTGSDNCWHKLAGL